MKEDLGHRLFPEITDRLIDTTHQRGCSRVMLEKVQNKFATDVFYHTEQILSPSFLSKILHGEARDV